MHNTRMKHLRYLTTAGIFAALIFVSTYFIHFNKGAYIHLGDAFLYLSACFLPTPYAAAAGAIGESFSDLIVAPVYIPATIIIKAVLTLFFTSKNEKIISKHNAIAVFLAGATGLAGYFLFESFIYHNIIGAAINILPASLQPIFSGILFILIGLALDKTNFKKRFQFD